MTAKTQKTATKLAKASPRSQSATSAKAVKATTSPNSTPTTNSELDSEALLLVAPDLPSPTVLAEYEQIVPGGAARLLDLAATRAQQARELERKTTESQIFLAKFRQAAFFTLALTAGIFGGLLLLSGSELAGLMVILIDAAVIASSIIYGQKA